MVVVAMVMVVVAMEIVVYVKCAFEKLGAFSRRLFVVVGTV
jgi:hypothetical protein